MVRTGWERDFAIPTRPVGSGVIRRAGVVVLSGLLGGETLSKVIINVVVGYFWMWSLFTFCRRWRWGCRSAANGRSKEPRGDREIFQGLGGSCTQVLVVIPEVP